MNPKLLIGVALLVVGVILLYMGYQETQTVGSQLSGAFGGSMSNKALLLLGAGGIAAVLGILSVIKQGR